MSKYNVKTHRNHSRLWLEGSTLTKLGFSYHDRYSVEYDQDKKQITIIIDSEGSRKISGRKRKGAGHHSPILDLCNAATTKTMAGCASFTVDPDSGQGLILLQGVS